MEVNTLSTMPKTEVGFEYGLEVESFRGIFPSIDGSEGNELNLSMHRNGTPTNCSELENFLKEAKTFVSASQMIVPIIYCIICLVGLIGNGLVSLQGLAIRSEY